jgi:PAS domain S-box-containing protein
MPRPVVIFPSKGAAAQITPQATKLSHPEQELKLYRQIFAASSDAIAIINAKGEYLEQNASHQKLLGFSDEDLRGKTPAIHMGEEAFARVARELSLSGRFRGELTSRTKSGEAVEIELSAFSMVSDSGEVLCHVGIKRDISDRKGSERELRARVGQQQAVVEFGQRALADSDLGSLMQYAAQLIAATLEVEYCNILELQPEANALLLRAGTGWQEGLVGAATVSAGRDSQAGYTLSTGESVVVQDWRRETRFSSPPLLREHKVVSGLSVVIQGVGGKPFGVLGAHSIRQRDFGRDQVNFLHAIANVLAAAIERNRAEQELRSRVRQQAAVVEFGQRALAITEPSSLMECAASLVASTLEVEYCKILQVLEDHKDLLLIAGVGWRDGYVGSLLEPAGKGSQGGFALMSSEPLIVEDLRKETRFQASPLLAEHGVVSGMSVIIGPEDRPFGVLGAHARRCRNFTRDDINFLQAIANTLATALDRTATEQALQANRERFRQAQLAANIAAYEWDVRAGNVCWSEQLPVLRGLAPDGKVESWLAHVHPEDRERLQQAIRNASKGSQEFDVQARLVLPDRSVVWLVSRGQVFCDHAGRLAHVVGIVLDITARKKAEEILQRSEKLAMLGRLAATIAHEINNPLEAVTNLLYLLENHPGLDGSGKQYAALAQQELHRVSHIARQTLGFHRESAKPIPVNLLEVLDNVLRLHERRIEVSGIAVDKRFDFEGEIIAFPAEMRQVFSNLVLNSLEAVGQGGRVCLHVYESVNWRHPQQRGVRVVIADNGTGIRLEHRHSIFEPFFTTKGEKGTGLGLWVTSGIVHKHGGSIRVHTSTLPGRSGSVFAVFLPGIVSRSSEVEPPMASRPAA